MEKNKNAMVRSFKKQNVCYSTPLLGRAGNRILGTQQPFMNQHFLFQFSWVLKDYSFYYR